MDTDSQNNDEESTESSSPVNTPSICSDSSTKAESVTEKSICRQPTPPEPSFEAASSEETMARCAIKEQTPGALKSQESGLKTEADYLREEDIKRRQREIDEADKERRRVAEERYEATQDARAFDEILAPFFEENQLDEGVKFSWTWRPEVERWSGQCRGVTLWCPPPESFR